MSLFSCDHCGYVAEAERDIYYSLLKEHKLLLAHYDDIYFYFGKQYEAMHAEFQKAYSQAESQDKQD